MATAYSEEVIPGGSGYNRIRLRVEYSGTSASCYIEFRRTSAWTDTWRDDQASITLDSTTVSAPYNYTGSVPASSDWSNPVQLTNASGFTVSTSGGTYNWHFNNPLQGSVLDCGGTITIPSQQVAPNTPTVSVATNTSDYTALNVTWGTSSYGTPSTGTSYIYRGASASPTYLMYSKTPTGTILWTNTGCTPNTRYYYRARAKNDADLWSSYSADSDAVTLARPASVSIADTTETSITVSYSTYADGGEYDKDIQYSIDGGTTWVTGATVTGGSVVTGTFTISGLTAHTSYTIRTRVSTTAGTSNGSTLSAIATNAKLYGSVNNQAKQIKKMYGSFPKLTVSGGSINSGDIVDEFIPANLASTGNVRLADSGTLKSSVTMISLDYTLASDTISIVISYSDGTTYEAYNSTLDSTAAARALQYGCRISSIIATPPSTDLSDYVSVSSTLANVAKKIVKIYGSVNGSAKLVYEDNS